MSFFGYGCLLYEGARGGRGAHAYASPARIWLIINNQSLPPSLSLWFPLKPIERHAAADVGEGAGGVSDGAEGVRLAETFGEEGAVAVGREEAACGGALGVEVAEAVA